MCEACDDLAKEMGLDDIKPTPMRIVGEELPGNYEIIVFNKIDGTAVRMVACDLAVEVPEAMAQAAKRMGSAVESTFAKLPPNITEEMMKAFKKGKR